ncbi:MAG: alpha/beta hydrolase [Muribaculaceae bacterium]|nr:alpha/beta hydrolase [Muribaculaceae bacterium]
MERSIEIDGVRAVYTVQGSGPQAVIVMHGWGCRAQTVALLADAAEGDSTTVYNIDLPGFGDSTEPPSVWGIDEYTGFLEKFIDTLGIASPVLIGHSFGGRMAINYASMKPAAKIILVDAAGIKPHHSLKYYIKVYSFKTAKKLLPYIVGKQKASQIIDRWRGKAGSADYAAASPVMRAVLSKVVNQDLTGRLPLIKAPALLIWGEKDTATPLADAKKMERLIPDAGLVSYPEAGHYSFLDRPGQTVAVIRSFLNLPPR